MDGLPLFHRIAGRPVLVVGQGDAAEARRRLIAEAGGTVVGEATPETRLAFVAVDDGSEAVAADLRARGLLVHVADRPELCDFYLPAIVDRSPVIVAIGTAGRSASLAKALKERLELLLPAGLGRLADAIREARPLVKAGSPTVAARRSFWSRLLAPGAPLDPLRDVADPRAAIAAGPDAPETMRVDTVMLGPPPAADRLTLGEARLLAQADLVLHREDAPADVLALVRRDAVRRVGDVPPAAFRGHVVVLRAPTQKA